MKEENTVDEKGYERKLGREEGRKEGDGRKMNDKTGRQGDGIKMNDIRQKKRTK